MDVTRNIQKVNFDRLKITRVYKTSVLLFEVYMFNLLFNSLFIVEELFITGHKALLPSF